MQNHIDVSIIIVSWNACDYLHTCLKSIYTYTSGVSFEVIVVDNNSSDNSVSMVEEHFKDVRLIKSNENLGFAKGNNVGILQSSGRYLCLINSDVELIENSIKIMFDYMKSQPSIGVLGPELLNADKTQQRSYKSFPTVWNMFTRALALDKIFPRSKLFGDALMTYFDGKTTQSVDVLIGAFWFIRRDATDIVGLLDEGYFMYSEDKDWCFRFKKHGWQVLYYPETKVIHYGGGSSTHASERFYIEQARSNLQYYTKNYGDITRKCLYFIMLFHNLIRLAGSCIPTFFRGGKTIRRTIMYYRTIIWLLKVAIAKDVKTTPNPYQA